MWVTLLLQGRNTKMENIPRLSVFAKVSSFDINDVVSKYDQLIVSPF